MIMLLVMMMLLATLVLVHVLHFLLLKRKKTLVINVAIYIKQVLALKSLNSFKNFNILIIYIL